VIVQLRGRRVALARPARDASDEFEGAARAARSERSERARRSAPVPRNCMMTSGRGPAPAPEWTALGLRRRERQAAVAQVGPQALDIGASPRVKLERDARAVSRQNRRAQLVESAARKLELRKCVVEIGNTRRIDELVGDLAQHEG